MTRVGVRVGVRVSQVRARGDVFTQADPQCINTQHTYLHKLTPTALTHHTQRMIGCSTTR